LDPFVAEQRAEHIRAFPPIGFELPDITSGERVIRNAAILFTSQRGKLLTDRYWAELWTEWRDAAGWPKEGTFHSLRHFFATTLMSNGVEPQDVQKALRHANLRITLETYVHWLPKKDRPRGVVGDVLRKAQQDRHRREIKNQDRS
jgi:integrase